MPKVLIKRGTRAQLNAARTANGLSAGELYLVTDENKLAVGTAVNAYSDQIGATGPAGPNQVSTTTSTNIAGLLKGASSLVAQAVAGTDYLAPAAIGTTVQAHNANLTTWAGKTAPAGTVVGTTDTQTLSGKTLTGTKETVFTVVDGASVTLNPANGGIQVWTLGDVRTAAVTIAEGEQMLLIAKGNFALTLTGVTYISATDAAGSAPVASASRARMIEIFRAGGVTYAGFVGYA